MMSDETRGLELFFQANQRLLAESPTIPTATVSVFLAIVLWSRPLDSDHKPLTINMVAQLSGVNYANTLQHCRYLGEGVRFGARGMGLITTHINPENKRQKIPTLTPKGYALIADIEELLAPPDSQTTASIKTAA